MTDTPGAKNVKAMDARDRISGLPVELRHHVLSFLPARDAARTCVLSPMWRQLWASASRLNVDAEGFSSQATFIKFVNALLLSRGSIPLNSFWLRANGPDIFLDNFRDTAYLWICYALRNNVEELGVINQFTHCTVGEFFQLQYCPFRSSCLKKLRLCYVKTDDDAIKKLFSGCPALEDLEMINCEMFADELSPATLKSLSIDYVDFPCHIYYDMSGRYIVINMPSLVSLHVGGLLSGAMLSLVDVRSLVTAAIAPDTYIGKFANCCKILGALSNVKKLELLIPYDMPHFRGNIGLSRSAAVLVSASPFNCEKLRKVEIVCSKGDKIVGRLVTILLTKMKSPPEISIKPFSGVS